MGVWVAQTNGFSQKNDLVFVDFGQAVRIINMSTAVFLEEFKGYPIFAIYKVGKNGRKIGVKPIVSFGATKAKAILGHIEEIQEWVDEVGADDDGDDDVPQKWVSKAASASASASTPSFTSQKIVTGADMAPPQIKVKPKITIKTPVKTTTEDGDTSAKPSPVIKLDLSNMSAEKQQAFALLFSANN